MSAERHWQRATIVLCLLLAGVVGVWHWRVPGACRQYGIRRTRGAAAAGRLDLGGQPVPQGHTFLDQRHEAVRIEIHVGQGGEYGFVSELVDGTVPHTRLDTGMGHHGKPFNRVNQEILQGCRIGRLAAYADFGATFPFSRLFALKTKHGMPP